MRFALATGHCSEMVNARLERMIGVSKHATLRAIGLFPRYSPSDLAFDDDDDDDDGV